MRVVIRPGIAFERVSGVFFACFPDEPFGPDDIFGGEYWLAIDAAEDGRDDRVIGFALAGTRDGRVHLNKLGVMPGHRGRGVGRALLNAVIDYAARANARAVTLGVRDDNMPALSLYKGAGFMVRGKRLRFAADYAILDSFDNNGLNPRLLAVGAPGAAGRVRFVGGDGSDVGHCSYNPAYPGCNGVVMGDPSLAMAAMRALWRFAGKPKTLYIVADDGPAADCLMACGLAPQYGLCDMELIIGEKA